jgi:hypothetical protein
MPLAIRRIKWVIAVDVVHSVPFFYAMHNIRTRTYNSPAAVLVLQWSAGSSLGGETQLLIEGFGVWLATQEVLERLHLFLAASAFEHGMPVPPTFLAVHWILFEDRVEHVGRVHLGTAKSQ